MKSGIFVYRRRVAYHETDAMGVVHHSNHIKYFEEARVEWLRDRGLMNIHAPEGPFVFAVIETQARYMRTARFDDELQVWLQARQEGTRIYFRYLIWSDRQSAAVAEGSTVLTAVNGQMRPARLPLSAREIFDREPWDTEWPQAAVSGLSAP